MWGSVLIVGINGFSTPYSGKLKLENGRPLTGLISSTLSGGIRIYQEEYRDGLLVGQVNMLRGKKKFEVRYENGQRSRAIRYIPPGQKSEEIEWHDGSFFREIHYYLNDQKGWESQFQNGQLVRTITYLNNQKSHEMEYQNGQRQRNISYDLRGQPVAELKCREGRPFEGRHVNYWEIGYRMEAEWQGGHQIGELEYYPNGRRARKVVWQKDKRMREISFDPRGRQVAELKFREGVPWDGYVVRYNPNDLKKIQEYQYHDGQTLGIVYYYPNGNKRSELEFLNNSPTREISHDLQGQPVAELLYKDGVWSEGRLVSFHLNGRVSRETEFQNGKCIRERTWDLKGREVPVIHLNVPTIKGIRGPQMHGRDLSD